MKKLYVLIDQKLDAVYGCVQGGHAVAQWLLEHPNQDWNNNYLIYLYADLDKWKVRLDLVNKDYSSFYELNGIVVKELTLEQWNQIIE